MKIGEIAQKTGVSRDTIRLYEARGILGEVDRPNEYNNYKEYRDDHVHRVMLVKQMKNIGLTLSECAKIIDGLVNDELTAEDRKQFVLSKIELVKQKIQGLQNIQSFLQEHIDNDCAFNSDDMISKLKPFSGK